MIGLYTVLPSGCSAANKKVALASNSPRSILSDALAAAKIAKSAQLAAMKARLDLAKPLTTTLLTEQPASLTITGLDNSKPLLWLGLLQQICFHVPPSANVNPKQLILYVGDGQSGTYYPNALGAGSGQLSADYQGCTPFTVSSGVPVGMYTIGLEEVSRGNSFASVSFQAGRAAIMFSTMTPQSGSILLTAKWTIDPTHATLTDTVKILNVQGTVVYWFYTSCRCQNSPGSATMPEGTFQFRLLKLNSVPG